MSGLIVAALSLVPALANAHPAGTSSISRYLDFEYEGDGAFRVAYLLDFAEAPAYVEIDALDADHDGAITPGEQEAYLARRLPALVAAWRVEINGERVRPEVVASHVEVSPGEGGLDVLRIEAELRVRAPANASTDVELHVVDDAFAARPGWREIHAEDARARDAASMRSPAPPDAAATRTFDARFHFSGEACPRAPRPGGKLWAVALAAALLAVIGVVTLHRRGTG